MQEPLPADILARVVDAPGSQSAYRQFYRTFAAVHRAHERWLGAVGSSGPRYAVMAAIRSADGPVPPSAIADAVGRPRNAVTPLLRTLEADGLIKRSPNTADARSHYVTLTRAGSRTVARWDAQEEAFIHRLFAGRPSAELGRLAAILDAIGAQARGIHRGR